MVTSTLAIPFGESAGPETILLWNLPTILLLTSMLLFAGTLLGECANDDQLALNGVPITALFSIGFSGVSLAYSAIVFVMLHLLIPIRAIM